MQEKPEKCFAHDKKFGKELCTCLRKLYCRDENGNFDYPSCRFYKTRQQFKDGQRLYPPREPLDQYKKYQRRSKNETT